MVKKTITTLFPFIGALALATGSILEKYVFKTEKTSIKSYQVLTFFFIGLVMIPLIIIFWQPIPNIALSIKNILIFVIVIAISTAANQLVFYSMKWEKLNNLEPAKILEPLFVVLLALIFSFFFGSTLYERKFNVLIPALIAGIALIFSHVKKHHLEFNKYFIAAIFGSLFFALELVISRVILDFYTPITFYFFRSTAIFLISLAIFRPKLEFSKKAGIIIFITSIIWVIYRVALYYGYLNLGVISTTLMIMLGPVFVYLFAHLFLKEKLNWRNIAAAIIIVASILYSILT